MCEPEENQDYYRDMPYGWTTYLIECKLFTHLRPPICGKQAFVFSKAPTDRHSLAVFAAVWVGSFSHGSRWAPDSVKPGGKGRPSKGRGTERHCAAVSMPDFPAMPSLPTPHCYSMSPPDTTALLPGTSVPEFTNYTHADYSLFYISQLYRGG